MFTCIVKRDVWIGQYCDNLYVTSDWVNFFDVLTAETKGFYGPYEPIVQIAQVGSKSGLAHGLWHFVGDPAQLARHNISKNSCLFSSGLSAGLHYEGAHPEADPGDRLPRGMEAR